MELVLSWFMDLPPSAPAAAGERMTEPESVKRYMPKFDSLHPDHVNKCGRALSGYSLRFVLALRRRASDGSEKNPYWDADSVLSYRHAVMGLGGAPAPLP